MFRFNHNEMEAGVNWLDGIQEINNYFWLGARDLTQSDLLVWIKSGETVPVVLLAPGEPKHISGDCVYLQRNGINKLGVYACDNLLNGALCEV